jgi:hypothetical protein
MVLERFLQAQPVDGCKIPVVEVEKLLERQLPDKLKESLLPFQWEGVRYALCRDGRCLLADEMGVGKTIQVQKLTYIHIELVSMRLPESGFIALLTAACRVLYLLLQR